VSTHPQKDIETLLSLMELDEQKKTFLTSEMKLFFKKTAETFTDSVSLLFITIHGEPASAILSFIQDGIYYLYNSGFDKVRHKNAGFYLKAKSIRYAIEHKCKLYNFLQGNERYKFDLGGKDFFVYRINWHR
jgi:lipid II:glycine glycyltransferase (peptidoglycan interpeptide bridge formation enzyme)